MEGIPDLEIFTTEWAEWHIFVTNGSRAAACVRNWDVCCVLVHEGAQITHDLMWPYVHHCKVKQLFHRKHRRSRTALQNTWSEACMTALFACIPQHCLLSMKWTNRRWSVAAHSSGSYLALRCWAQGPRLWFPSAVATFYWGGMENFVYQALGAHQGLARIGDRATSDWPKTAAFWPMWLTKMTIGSHIYEWSLCNQLGCATSVRRHCEGALKETQVVKIRCYHVSQVRRFVLLSG